jgi:hypothetical protein
LSKENIFKVKNQKFAWIFNCRGQRLLLTFFHKHTLIVQLAKVDLVNRPRVNRHGVGDKARGGALHQGIVSLDDVLLGNVRFIRLNYN